MTYFIYILQSQVDGSYYIGSTGNLQQRLAKHNNARSGYTSRKKPWTMVYFESFNTKTEALIRERFLKAQKNREFFAKLIASGTNS